MQAIINATNKLFVDIQKEITLINGLSEEQILQIEAIFAKNFEGKGKGKARKTKESTGTRPKTGYQIYAKYHRQELKDANELEGKEFGEISKMIGAHWKALGAEQDAWKKAAAAGLEKPPMDIDNGNYNGNIDGDDDDTIVDSSHDSESGHIIQQYEARQPVHTTPVEEHNQVVEEHNQVVYTPEEAVTPPPKKKGGRPKGSGRPKGGKKGGKKGGGSDSDN